MSLYPQRFDEWMNPNRKFRFISINNFAAYLGIKQTAVMDLVRLKRIDSVVIDGKTYIPFSSELVSMWNGEPRDSQLPDWLTDPDWNLKNDSK